MCSLCECTHVCTNTGCRFYGPPDSGRVIARGTRVKTKSGPQPRGTLRPCACYRKRVRKSRKVKQQCTKTPIKYYYLRPPPPPPPRFCGQKRFWRREHHTRRTKKKKNRFQGDAVSRNSLRWPWREGSCLYDMNVLPFVDRGEENAR